MFARSVVVVVAACVVSTLLAVTPGASAAPKKAAATRAAGSGAGSAGSGAGSGSGSAAAPPVVEEPPADMNGTTENPDAPKLDDGEPKVVAVAPKPVPLPYPTEEVLRPITLPQNMTEVSIGPHFEINDDLRQGFVSSDALRARYGITKQIQIGLTYGFAGIYHDPATANAATAGALGLEAGKAVGLDLTVLVQKWLAVRVGVPIYVSPLALSLTLGAPIKFVVFDKLAIGGLDQIFNIKLDRFAPQFYQEYDNALAAFETQNGGNNTTQPDGYITVSGFVEYQYSPDLAILGRFGEYASFGNGGNGAGADNPGTSETFLRAGLQWTPRNFIDLGFTLGFDDLGHGGTFGPAGILAVRL